MRVIVIMNTDPSEMKDDGIRTVYKCEDFGGHIISNTSFTSIVKYSGYLSSFFSGDRYQLDENNPLSSYIEPFMFESYTNIDSNPNYIIELEVPSEYLDSLIATLQDDSLVLKIGTQLTSTGLYSQRFHSDPDAPKKVAQGNLNF